MSFLFSCVPNPHALFRSFYGIVNLGGKTMDKEKMGLFIAELRKEKGLTQEELAQQFYVDRATISKWEKGYYIPTPEMLLELSNFFGITVNEILLGEKKSETNQDEVNKVTVEILKNRDQKIKKISWVSVSIILLLMMVGVGTCLFFKLEADRKLAETKNWLPTLREGDVPYYLKKDDLANDFTKEHFQAEDKVDIYIKGDSVPLEYQEEPFITNIVLKRFTKENGKLEKEASDFLYVYFGIDSEAQDYLKRFTYLSQNTFEGAKFYFVKSNSTDSKCEVNEKLKKLLDEQIVQVEVS